MCPSPVLALEFAHEADERLDGRHGHGVIQARAHAPENAVALEIVQSGRCGLLQELGVERILRERERHVHPGTRVLRDAIFIQGRAVDGGVKGLSLGPVALAHGREPPLLLQPFQHQSGHVPGKRGRRIEERPLLRHPLVIENRGSFLARLAE